jgi:hypothetical protein
LKVSNKLQIASVSKPSALLSAWVSDQPLAGTGARGSGINDPKKTKKIANISKKSAPQDAKKCVLTVKVRRKKPCR